MRNNSRIINLFVSHPFQPSNDIFDLEKFRTNIQLMVREAEIIVRKEYNDFELNTIFEFNDFAEGLPKQIKNSIEASHFAIVDVTENKPNIFFEYGMMKGLNVPSLLIKTKKSFKEFDLPADIKDEIAVKYDNFDELKNKCTERIADLFRTILNNGSLYNIHLKKIWFPIKEKAFQDIHVIVSSLPDKRSIASPNSDNYEFLENVGDKDALLEVMTFLSRIYRNVNIIKSAADKFDPDYKKNIVIIGGPGSSKGSDYRNKVCREFMEIMDVKISYSDDCENMLYGNESFKAERKKDGTISIDYGYFARFPNPLQPQLSIILIHGIHTFGVLGAAKAFTDNPNAQENIKKVINKLEINNFQQASFECFFPVQVLLSDVVCPRIEEKYILPLSIK